MSPLATFKEIILTYCGLQFPPERERTLLASVHSRMAKVGIDTPDAYVRLLKQAPQELAHLVDLLTVNETYFFREEAAIDLFVGKLLPQQVVSLPLSTPVKILCAGCSTGEEPYSLAIRLYETYGPEAAKRYQITAIDIDATVLETAQRGLYRAASFRSCSPERKKKFFHETKMGTFELKAALRNMVTFQRCNLVKDSVPSHKGYHAIFYRNVSIYFPRDIQKLIFEKLAAALLEKGALFLGSAETLFHNFGRLSLVGADGCFYFSKTASNHIGAVRRKRSLKRTSPPAPRVSQHVAPAQAEAVSIPPVQPPKKNLRKGGDFDTALQLGREKRFVEGLAALEICLERDPEFSPGHSLRACLLMNLQQQEEAMGSCLKALEIDPLCLEATLLLGMIANSKERVVDALRHFREAIYIQPQCWLAHYYLGEIQKRNQEIARAKKSFQQVVNILNDNDLTDHGLSFFPLSFKSEHFIRLCQQHISRLS